MNSWGADAQPNGKQHTKSQIPGQGLQEPLMLQRCWHMHANVPLIQQDSLQDTPGVLQTDPLESKVLE